MSLFSHPVRASMVTAGSLALVALATVATTSQATASARPSMSPSTGSPGLSVLRQSLPPTTDKITGAYSSRKMSVEVALEARNQSTLNAELSAVYDPRSPQYHHFLPAGAFDRQYAPTTAEQDAVAGYLRAAGLTVQSSGSPFLVRATGDSAQVSSAFHTTLTDYRDPKGTEYFSNADAVKLPSALAGDVEGVVGLTNTVQAHDSVIRSKYPERSAVAHSAATIGTASCEATYPTVQGLIDLYQDGNPLPLGYGGGPGCSGLTPSQVNSIYGAPDAGPRGKGAKTTLAVFELSAYQHSDIDHWATTFYGPGYTPRLTDVNVDGGPLNPDCPAGDSCQPASLAYFGDVEVDADIEATLAVAPDEANLLVYNAPSDETGQTLLDEYTLIADQDKASTVSTSWGLCENDATTGFVEAENTVFEQMALQGQSVFAAAGDTGAFGCSRSDGTNVVNVVDPSSQPWVTGVGGTSLESDNPGANQAPSYPATGESAWNPQNLCSESQNAPGGVSGLTWCAESGAGGGGSSQFWGQPSYQKGPGVNNSVVTHGNGSTACSLAATGTPCRQVPDISANADQFTAYAEFCTGNASTPGSACATAPGSVPGWFGIGGTSLATPTWAAILADRDSYQGQRSGNANVLLYQLFNADAAKYFHDVTGKNQPSTNNGLFPTTTGYDEATGIGTPKMAALRFSQQGRVGQPDRNQPIRADTQA
ncbi:MAG: S53 family peptidase [Trebonia sp.]